jgi:hypothetical protein
MSALPLLARIWRIAQRARRCGFGLNWLTPSQPSGPLTFDTAVLPSAVYPVGCFVIT